MKEEEMDAIDRALLYLAKTVYANHGLVADFRIVPVGKDKGRERGRSAKSAPPDALPSDGAGQAKPNSLVT